MASRWMVVGIAALALSACGDTNIYVPGPDAPQGPDQPGPRPDPDPTPTPDPAPDPTPDPVDPDDPLPVDPDDPLAPDLLDMRGDFDEMGARAVALDPTRASAVPVSGAATYKGTAELALGSGDGAALLYGDARIRADFEDGTVSGKVDNFLGAVGDGPIQAWDGKVDIEELSEEPGSPDATALASGELTAGGTVLTVDTTLEGGFLGADAGTVGLGSTGGTGSIDGRQVGASLELWAEQVWRGE